MNLEKAINFIFSSINAFPIVENIKTHQSYGRVLAENLSSPRDIPPFDNSQVDGYVVNSSDINQHESFVISQRIPAGFPGTNLQPSTVARIFTGACIPENSDSVVMQEETQLVDKKVTFKSKIIPGQFIRKKGSDLKKNQIFFETGRLLTAADVGMCASVGFENIKVFKKLRVAVFSSGDELKQPGENLDDGQIYDSNRPMIKSLVSSMGCDVIDMGCIPDDFNQTKEFLLNASKNVEVILTCGGVSVGEEDHIRSAVESLGEIHMWKIEMKPGKPFAFGSIGSAAFLGMPGNPVSAWVTFVLLCRPYLIKRSGGVTTKNNFFPVECDFDRFKSSDRREFLRGRIMSNGKLSVYKNQNSQILSSVCFSNGLIELPPGKIIKKGDKLNFYPFSEIS